MKLIQQIVFFFLMASASVAASAQNAPAYSRQHLAAAARVVKAMGLPERFIIPTKQLLQGSMVKDPENALLMSATMAPYLQKQYTVEQLKAPIASLFDAATCRQIATFWEGPVGKKLVHTKVQMLSAGEGTPLVFTPREKTLMQRFDGTRAGKAFVAALPDIEDMLAEYTKNTQTTMRERFLLDLEKKLKQATPTNPA